MNDMWISDPKVAETMTVDYGSVDQTMPVQDVIDTMLQNSWDEVIVRDEQGELTGLVTKEHLVSQISRGFDCRLPIKDISRKKLVTTNPRENLSKARDIMRDLHIGRLPVIDDNGQIVGLLTAKDVCNGFSSKLWRQGEQLSAVIENITEAIQVIDCDGMVSFWNSEAERLFGIKGADIVGRKLGDFMPGDLPLQAIETLQTYRNVVGELGCGIPVVRNAAPVINPDGVAIGAVCTTTDVSHLKSLMDKLNQANRRVRTLERFMIEKDTQEDVSFYTTDPHTQRLLEQARRVAKTDATVLIQGPSGTGKELLARLIHTHSKRADKPLIEVNCSAIPESLFESEMFGYEAGAFTGGSRTGKAGKFELANGAAIFLDEIGELPLDMQAKLLRVIQERRFYRVGGIKPIDVDVRLIAATNRDIAQLVRGGKFREDLFYRLNVITFEIPSLEARKCDIPGLVGKYLQKLSRLYDRDIERIGQEVMDLFMRFDWPGNVRQLQNVLESIVILMEGNVISMKTLEEVRVLDVLTGHKGSSAGEADTGYTMYDDNLKQSIDQREREMIIKALRDCAHNKSSAAKMLSIPRSTLYYKMKALGIEDDHINLY
ncbi:MAG: sigma 54-interacting transcriptional regulator [Syntrophomonadaceae bacterium]